MFQSVVGRWRDIHEGSKQFMGGTAVYGLRRSRRGRRGLGQVLFGRRPAPHGLLARPEERVILLLGAEQREEKEMIS